MVPADKKLYALRDASGTVPSIPLITASILSKKLAESLDALVLDVKFGCAAFMPTRENARKLAQALVALGNDCGVNTRAILTDMNTPLGRAAGNWLEVKESVACLGRQKARRICANWPLDLLPTHLLVQTGRSKSSAAARKTGGRLFEFRRTAPEMGRNARGPRRRSGGVQQKTRARPHRAGQSSN